VHSTAPEGNEEGRLAVRRHEFATEALVIATIVAIVIGLYSLVPHIRNERLSQVLINPPGPNEPLQLTLDISGPGTFAGTYTIDASTPLAEVLRTALVEQDHVPGTVSLVVGAAGQAGPQRVDLNHADAWLLEALPGIGPGKAQAIVEYRATHGPFSCVEEISLVPGIGASTFETLRELVTVTP
jgi:competence protein ComEA